ncbi:Antibiotic biosynthesis monooxygenase [[Actinomadura] parvosata subsp. kistnae]|uniref:ABM domain-containing protein n=1 Tax=[Actinomadura] parvosata subsp. kistnae TaxID=1909395 RepID=A0A1U9ZZZ0_9ACTN|nr:antibiotic biosynthesis monooxygenase family protein [Nonomuraea sp. ATCC 55076]AQZ63515.1 hypothetical protein BKM31_20455 [Nonomuraea sp. ATCC 55076]SPL99265.1 Antibiotic biosynthesis monooxygenase [Actinomadura parvosata subsp. kistnae]
MASGVFRVMLRMRIKPGMTEEFEQAWFHVSDLIRHHPANRGQWLSRSAEEPGVYYVVSDWTDEPRFREFEKSDRHAEHRAKLAAFRSASSMTTMSVVHDLPRDARAHQGPPKNGGPVSGQVRVLLHITAEHSGAAAVEDAYHRTSRALRGIPGLLGNELLRSAHDPTSFAILSWWRDMDAYLAWEQDPAHRTITAPLRPMQDTSRSSSFAVYTAHAAYHDAHEGEVGHG